MKQSSMKQFLLSRAITHLSVVALACLFYVVTSYAEGFLAGTLVRTPTTYKPLEELQVDDTVVSHDLK